MANIITFISIVVTFALSAAYTMTIVVTVAHVVTIATRIAFITPAVAPKIVVSIVFPSSKFPWSPPSLLSSPT